MSPLRVTVALLAAASAGAAGAQTMLDQEERLIDIHSLLLDLPAAQAPGALGEGELSLALELIGIPDIDGTTGTKRQITASDRTRVFPRPRLALGLAAPFGLRGFVGLAYIPPVEIREVSTHFGALEAGLAYAPAALAVGLRGRVAYARSRAPVTESATRDELESLVFGADLSAGYRFDVGGVRVTPYAGLGVVSLDGDFTVTSDGVLLTSEHTGLALQAGLRLLLLDRFEAVAEVDAYPGRLVHPSFRLGYVADLGW